MLGEVVHTPAGGYVRCAAQAGMIVQEQDVLELLACCGDLDSNRVLIDKKHLHPDFFDLSTGLAGTILQKFATYYVKAAFVVDPDAIVSAKFRELTYECNKGDQVHFFAEVAPAEAWLVHTSG